MRIPNCLALALCVAGASHAQELALDRLPAEDLPVTAPSGRVLGVPGEMRIAEHGCRADPAPELRRSIVNIAIQEWGYFGFGVVDQTQIIDEAERQRRRQRFRRGFSWLDPETSARVADSIAGYWAVTSDGAWILDRQNAQWQGPGGVAARWRDPWSAAFISWVMCESGLDDAREFRRAIAHHLYIDQAIEARDEPDSDAAYAAYDVGERPVEPGDMLCSARRPAYRSIADRRPQLGVGMRSHCDIVVKVDADNARILVIGGNVRGAVNLKLLPAAFAQQDGQTAAVWIGRGRRAVFAHLKLRAPAIESDALEKSPTLEALREREDALAVLEHRLAGQVAGT